MRKSWRWPLAGFVTGGLVGMTLLTVNIVGAVVERGAGGAERRGIAVTENKLVDVLHKPASLVSAGSRVELRYEGVCIAADPAREPCALDTTLFVRPVGERGFTQLPLSMDANGAFVASLPASFTRGDGFDYYAVMNDRAGGTSITMPAGGAAAPHHAWVVRNFTSVALNDGLGATRAPDETVLRSSWGDGAGQLGLDAGKEQSTVGPSSFAVAADGTAVVLDQVNRRLVFKARGANAARHVPIDVTGAMGDVALGADGAIFVLDDGGAHSDTPLLRTFGSAGEAITTTPLAQDEGDILRVGPQGPLVHAYPSKMWVPTGGAIPLTRDQQLARARTSRAVGGGREIVVSASPTDARFAIVAGPRVLAAWRVTSSVNLGEVQLAEPDGSGLFVVLRRWTETASQFQALRLTSAGVRDSFAVEAPEWAESSPLSRFRLRNGSLYQLRSTSAGADVVAFRIGGTP